MTRRRWPMVSMLLCFICLTAYMVVNDLNYRMDTAYRGIQVKTYQTYSYWHRYIGTLKGLLLETDGFGETLDTATALERRTKLLIAELRADSARTDPEIRKSIDAFTGSIEGGIKIGQEVIDTGYLFLNQPDLPPGFREGRVGLSSLSGRDATAFLGKRSAYGTTS